jgi:hypothetical protein
MFTILDIKVHKINTLGKSFKDKTVTGYVEGIFKSSRAGIFDASEINGKGQLIDPGWWGE